MDQKMSILKEGDMLIKKIIESGGDNEGVFTNDLLVKFFHGYPLKYIYLLIESENDKIVEAGAWLLSELGKEGKPFVPILHKLLSHNYWKVRFWAFDPVLTCVGSDHPELIVQSLLMAEDDLEPVRWRAMNFLYRESNYLLSLAMEILLQGDKRKNHIEGIKLLTSIDKSSSISVHNLLNSHDYTLQLYGAVCAARLLAKFKIRDMIEEASYSNNLDVRKFSKSILSYKRHLPVWER